MVSALLNNINLQSPRQKQDDFVEVALSGLIHSIEKETVCSSASDGGFLLETFDDVIKYNTGKSLLCFLKIGGNHEVQLLAAAATRCSIPVVYN